MSKRGTSWFSTYGKFLGLFASLLTVLLPSAAYASGGPAPDCMVSTIDGTYAFATVGQEVGGYGASVFLITSDGKGNLSGSGSENSNGTSSSGVTASGTYTVTLGCWFTVTTTDSLGNVRNIGGTIGQNGFTLVGASTDAGTELQFIAYKLHSTSCTQAIAASYFVWEVQDPLTPKGSSVATHEWYVNDQGAGTDTWVADFGGTNVNGTATGTFSVDSNCTFTIALTNNDSTTNHFFGVAGITLNDVASLFIETDSGWVGLGTSYFKK